MDVNVLIAALAGFIGAIILTLCIYILKIFGQNIDIPFLIGSRLVNIENTTKVYTVGIFLHLFIGAVWGILYVVLLTGLGLAASINWPAGLLWGFAHGIFVGITIGIVADQHPQIGEGKDIKHPGIMGRKWGTAIPYWILILHIIYGGATLWIYHLLMT